MNSIQNQLFIYKKKYNFVISIRIFFLIYNELIIIKLINTSYFNYLQNIFFLIFKINYLKKIKIKKM